MNEDDRASLLTSSSSSNEHRLTVQNGAHQNGTNLFNASRDGVLSDNGTQVHKDHILQQLAEKQFPLEDTELIVKAFEKTVIGHDRASYYDGIRMQEVVDGVAEPKIGITFMAGADTPQVNQLEEIGMRQTTPDQKDASWRVKTAGALLRNFEVDKDMAVINTDNTATVVANARHRRILEDGPFFERTAPSKSITNRGRDREDRTVTIDSDNVQIVNNLNAGQWDLQSTLIEVDQSSILSLVINYKALIRRGGPALTFTDTIELLETMIEDARRLCVRSPILFRMSTRRHIIASKNTRYGVDHGSMFQTLTTSSGIKNIISLSAAYFNSLSSADNTDKSQELIRPRFLQMLVLLLSLLNDDDLNEISEFLEVTYNLRADRQHVELLILKVLPLMSINSQIFIKDMVVAIEGPVVNIPTKDEVRVWNIFVEKLLQLGYMLPGTIEQLGQTGRSWVVKWPEKGIKDSHIFKNLQYAGENGGRTINEIPPMKLNFNVSNEELTIILTDGCKYVASNSDLENLIRMSPGRYSLNEVERDRRTFDMAITEMVVSEPLHKAINKLNTTLTVINGFLASPERSGVLVRMASMRRRGSGKAALTPFAEIKAAGRLTFSSAQLNEKTLAVAYKIDGRKITRRDLIRTLAFDLRKLRSTIHSVEAAMQEFEGRRISSDVRQNLPGLRRALLELQALTGHAEENKARMEAHNSQLADEPVSKVLYPSGADRSSITVWHEYKSWYLSSENLLQIDAQRRTVRSFNWVSDDIIEVFFYGHPMKYFVSPLRSVFESERADEIQENDQAILVGQYIVIALPGQGPGPHKHPEEIANWLKIAGVEEEVVSRRGRNRSSVVETQRWLFR